MTTGWNVVPCHDLRHLCLYLFWLFQGQEYFRHKSVLFSTCYLFIVYLFTLVKSKPTICVLFDPFDYPSLDPYSFHQYLTRRQSLQGKTLLRELDPVFVPSVELYPYRSRPPWGTRLVTGTRSFPEPWVPCLSSGCIDTPDTLRYLHRLTSVYFGRFTRH